MTSTTTRKRFTAAERTAHQEEALARATLNSSMTNWPAIVRGFTAKGIPEADIRPRENVLTYNAWRARGRQVRRGEHGVRVVTFIPSHDRPGDRSDGPGEERRSQGGRSRPWSATVFHESQTDPIATGRPAAGVHDPEVCTCLVCRAIRGE